MSRSENLLDYSYDETVGRQLNVLIVIKGFNQLAIIKKIIERKKSRNYSLTAANNISQRIYYRGTIVETCLDRNNFSSTILNEKKIKINCLEPYSISIKHNKFAYIGANQVFIIDLVAGQTYTLTNEWMAFLHTVEFSRDDKNVLLASSGFDIILEINIHSAKVLWEWNSWDQGFNYSKLTNTYVTRNRSQLREIEQNNKGSKIIFVKTPKDYPIGGIPTEQCPARINGASYDENEIVLATSYHRPELFIIQKNNDSFQTVDLGLSHPHGFIRVKLPYHDGYMVTNTGAGEFLLVDKTFNVVNKLVFSSLSASATKEQGFGEWIQNVTLLDPQKGIFAAVDSLRGGIHIIDFLNKRRRFINNPPEWTIQTLISISKEMIDKMRQIDCLYYTT
jgi:hypothetical protein